MNQDFENQLRDALRAVEPSDGFTARVMRALPERRAPATVTPIVVPLAKRQSPARAWQRFAAPLTLAASLVMALLLGQQVALRRERLAGEAAQRELMQALRVTSQKLDLAYQAVQPPAPSAAGAPAEENRS